MLLTIRAVANPNETSIRRLAERLALRHHSAVGLIDRLEAHGYVRRIRNGRDQRRSVSSCFLPGSAPWTKLSANGWESCAATVTHSSQP